MTEPTRGDERIPVSAPDLSGNEEAYVLDAVRSSWISSTGEYVTRFEREFADAVGTRAAITVANGTVALHLALLAHGVGSGDEVIVPSLTYIATANAVRYTGANPVFVDVDPSTWCLDPNRLEEAIGPRTRGVLPVDLYGHPADMDAINDIAARHDLWVVEDAAEAFGATYKGRQAGSLASIGTFSFYGNKILTSGEGGAITVNDEGLEVSGRLLRGQGMDPQRRYHFPIIGYNYRLTNVACAILCAQMERSDQMLAARHRSFNAYRAGLADIEGIGFQPIAEWAEPAPWLFGITVDEARFGKSRDRLMTLLEADGIETRPFFPPIHRQPAYEGRPGALGPLPVTDQLGATGLSLPTFSTMTERQILRVVTSIERAGQA